MPHFVPRERKHRRIARQKQSQAVLPQNGEDLANAEVILPVSKSEREDRRQRLRADLNSQQPDKINSKKRKRLDKYIDTKLKKEENLDLLKKLATQKVDTSLFQSSKKLGRVGESKRERLSRTLREREAGVDVDGHQEDILFQQRAPVSRSESGDSEDEDDHVDDYIAESNSAIAAGSTQPSGPLSFGSGLKRQLDTGDVGRPTIKRRKRRKQTRKLDSAIPPIDDVSSEASAESAASTPQSENGSDTSEWEGFESETSQGESVSDRNDKGEEDSDVSEDSNMEDRPARVSAFKAWADSQRHEALGFTPSAAVMGDDKVKAAFVLREASPDPVALELLATPNKDAYRPSASVSISRSEEVQASRMKLPVVQDEQKIIEAIHNNSVTVVCGATGSGKTTQIPQMLLENGYGSTGLIGITQPRRIAATSVASRVAHELGREYGKKVAHQVRYDSNVSRDTVIKFMTDGVLLREISQDFALKKYSVIVIDEAHERSVNTDILIGMLSRIVPLRQELSREAPGEHHPLKLIVMSATLRVTDFLMNERLFKTNKPPIVEAAGRQYHVTEHFARRTHRDYASETASKVQRAHKKLPPGSILVFLTGQDEIQIVAKVLQETVGRDEIFVDPRLAAQQSTKNDYLEDDEGERSESEAEFTGLDDDDDAEFEVEPDTSLLQKRGNLKALVLPLYAALPAHQQLRVFETPPDGYRAIILATNVAETSLTIPGVRYVFDCGRSKEKCYDTATGVQEFKIDWISKASALQRMGRAGRTGPGHCYRLYSSAIYEQYFSEHSLPEILRTPIEGTVLQLKNMDVDNVVNFPFPTPPQAEQLAHAERLLKNLGAIDGRTGKVADVGRELIHYPVNPRFGKMLLLGLRNGALANTIALVAGLAVGDLMIPEPQLHSQNIVADGDSSGDDGTGRDRVSKVDDAATHKRRQAFGRARATLSAWDDKSDAVKLLTAVAAHAQSSAEGNSSFCEEYFLREKGMIEVQQLRHQLHNIMQGRAKEDQDVSFPRDLAPPTPKEISILKQIVAAGYIDNVAIRADLLPTAIAGRKPRRAIEVPYRTLVPSIPDTEIDHSATPEDQQRQKSVYIHASSVLAKLSTNEMPSYIIYSHLSRATAGTAQRVRMHPLTSVGPRQLAALAEGTPLLEIGKPIGKIVDKDVGKQRECWVGVSLRDPGAAGTTGWPLGAWKVLQARKGLEWRIEKVLDRGK